MKNEPNSFDKNKTSYEAFKVHTYMWISKTPHYAGKKGRKALSGRHRVAGTKTVQLT